jgi:hypothetical protein
MSMRMICRKSMQLRPIRKNFSHFLLAQDQGTPDREPLPMVPEPRP